MIKILGISGSLRRASFNTALLHAAPPLLPEGASLEFHAGLRDIPPYDEDVRQAGFPAVVAELRQSVRDADALLIATPEYNRSISGVLKNAIDWVSRPPDQPFNGKVVAIMGASPGALGTGLAHYHLRQVLSTLGAYAVPGAEMLVGNAATKFDASGALTDDPTRVHLQKLLNQLVVLAGRLR
ncbi:NADPH-dependent FMN reductase [Nguyenibacter vanlangensis]|uniref:NAD(P)H-dependent oxidoreductase n=1 Tax=Nguyenibacter vanlangensis TaxID=1216886 RepID=A0A7Y7IUW5_9PROT|nr:NADPH-dependent FMN reductase [Nguyenibacter vanlangensis]NVN10528.1 NAD(P)H-dependent oxidoreductase [Nguyenibacter vanlangensis]